LVDATSLKLGGPSEELVMVAGGRLCLSRVRAAATRLDAGASLKKLEGGERAAGRERGL